MMASDLDDLERLLAIAASARTTLSCPKCGNADDENFEIFYKVEFRSPAPFDGPAKNILPEYGYEEFVNQLGEPTLSCCNCSYEFPVPAGWQIIATRNSEPHQPGDKTPARKAPAKQAAPTPAEKMNDYKKKWTKTEKTIKKGLI